MLHEQIKRKHNGTFSSAELFVLKVWVEKLFTCFFGCGFKVVESICHDHWVCLARGSSLTGYILECPIVFIEITLLKIHIVLEECGTFVVLGGCVYFWLLETIDVIVRVILCKCHWCSFFWKEHGKWRLFVFSVNDFWVEMRGVSYFLRRCFFEVYRGYVFYFWIHVWSKHCESSFIWGNFWE